jgi:fumarylpyruvate hydrolase
VIPPPPPLASLPVSTGGQRFPIRRVFCVGRNYAAHAREMGNDPDREPPFFMKPADAVVDAKGVILYPSLTSQFHHEVETAAAPASISPDVMSRTSRSVRAQPEVSTTLVGTTL